MVKAFVLCGGVGTRLRPYTYTVPKPMLTLGKKPILEYVINNLERSGFTDLVLTVGYLQDKITDYFGDGSGFGVSIEYAVEAPDAKLGTAGSIYPYKEVVKEPFIVVMGDHLTNCDLRKLYDYHIERSGPATVAFKRTGVPIEYGIAHIDGDNHVTRFEEKPIVENLINAGMYAFDPEVFDHITEKCDFAKNVFPSLLNKKKFINAYLFNEYWIDIGRLKDYEELNTTISVAELIHK